MIETRFVVDDTLVLIKLPIQEQRYAYTRKAEVYNGNTKLATLSEIADIEAIALRHQSDLEPLHQSRVRISALRALGGSKFWGAFGKLGKTQNAISNEVTMELEERKTPDMRAWLSLPEEFLAARIRVSKNMRFLTLVTKDSKGKVIAKKTIKLNRNGANFVFARSMGGNLSVYNNKEHWIKW